MCSSMVIAHEIIVSILASCVVVVTGLLGSLILVTTGDITIEVAQDEDDASQMETNLDIPVQYKVALALIAAFLNAFLVASLVEEIGKYLCFWMLEHPDLQEEEILAHPILETQLGSSKPSSVTTEDTELLPSKTPEPISLVSRGSATTIAMVTTALGFACAENLLYVFVYTPPGLASEISTLIVRCMFPVHPIAAAIQSVGVCRRDLECDASSQMGRILFPAWLLHGTFDFVLMAYAVVSDIMDERANEPMRDSASSSEKNAEPVDLKELDPILFVVFVIPLLALVYYFNKAWAQRKRLAELDRQRDRARAGEGLGGLS